VGFAVVNATIRAEGKVYSISIEGSGLDESLVAGRLKERLMGVEGVVEAIGSFVPVTE
jgi:hypothetical protein